VNVLTGFCIGRSIQKRYFQTLAAYNWIRTTKLIDLDSIVIKYVLTLLTNC